MNETTERQPEMTLVAEAGGVGSLNLNTRKAIVSEPTTTTASSLSPTSMTFISQAEVNTVSLGQTFNVVGNPTLNEAAKLTVDNPTTFQGSVNLDFGQVILTALQTDSYSYSNDLLSLYSKGSVIDTLKLDSPASFDGQAMHLSVFATSGGVMVDNTGWGGGVLLHQIT